MNHQVNAIINDDFWQVVKHEKLQEGNFEVESAISIGSSHWCRPTPTLDHRSTLDDDHRSSCPTYHRSTKSIESVASSQPVRILTHEDFTAPHPHPPTILRLSNTDINRHTEPHINRQRDSTDDRHKQANID